VRLYQLLEEADDRTTRTGGMTHEEFWKAVDERYDADDVPASDPT
jgi:hypothetical protein